MSPPPRILVAIVNYRSGPLVNDLLRSLEGEIGAPFDLAVRVVDNCSGDGSADLIRSTIEANGWTDWASVQVADRNGGFAYGNNLAIRTAVSEQSTFTHALLLNPDTTVRPGAIRELVALLDAKPEAGIAGSRLEFPDGSQQHSCFRFFDLWTEFQSHASLGVLTRLKPDRSLLFPLSESEAPMRVDWLAGASMMIRREVIDDIGLLDDEYFLYYEEVDYCRNAAAAGWTCWYVPKSRVVHHVGQTTGVTNLDDVNRRRPRYWFESRRRYFKKQHGRLFAIFADLSAFAGSIVDVVKHKVRGGRHRVPARFFRDLITFNLHPVPRETPQFTRSAPSLEDVD